jgi:glycosyltransferase involved in cell wall biosynthesis
MRPGQDPLVSVVTPVYNGERTLRQCVESVLAQTYSHWDYTIVNNCSTDATLDIAREYADRDRRIRVCSSESFVRVIPSHNNAFRQISPDSKYCKVVAADDQLLPECLEQMVRLAEEHPAVAIVGAYGRVGDRVIWGGLPPQSTVVNGRELCRATLLGGPYVFGTPTALLYRSDIVRSRHGFFNESNLHSDAEACLEFLEHHDFGFVHQVLSVQEAARDSMTSFSESFQTYLPWHLQELVVYGPKYLTEGEIRVRIRSRLDHYYRYLGKQVYKRRSREFWAFHNRRMAELGYPMSTPRLVGATILCGFGFATHPRRSARSILLRIPRGRSRSSRSMDPAPSEAESSAR